MYNYLSVNGAERLKLNQVIKFQRLFSGLNFC